MLGNNHITTPWSEENTKKLIELFEAGYSYSLIGEELGFNRDKIAGKCKRLKLVRNGVKPTKFLPSNPGSNVKGRTRTRRVRIAPTSPIEPMYIPLKDLKSKSCRFPLGTGSPYSFCGHETVEGSYCHYHDYVVHHGYPKKKSDYEHSRH